MRVIVYYDFKRFPNDTLYHKESLVNAMLHREEMLKKIRKLKKSGYKVVSKEHKTYDGLPAIEVRLKKSK